MKINLISKLFCFLFIILILVGCNDLPTPVGKKILPTGDIPIGKVDTFYATNHSSIYNVLSTDYADRIMLGKYGIYESWACLKFEAFPKNVLGATVTSANILLTSIYQFGDTTASFSFEVYRLKVNWDSLTGDLLQKNIIQQNPQNYYDLIPLNVQIQSINDTVIITILDTAMVREWLSSNYDTTHLNDGIILKPTNSSLIKGFSSFSNSYNNPALIIEYEGVSDTGIYSHTSGFSKYISIVDSLELKNNDDLIYVQNGISYRGLLKFDTLKYYGPYYIAKAELQITLDSASSFRWSKNILNNYLYTFYANEDGTVNNLGYSIMSSSFTNSLNMKVYKFDIRSLLNYCRPRNIVPILGLVGSYENKSLDLFSIYGANSSTLDILKPKIIISYSVQY